MLPTLVVQRGDATDGFRRWMSEPAVVALGPESLQRLETIASEQLLMMKKWVVKTGLDQLGAVVDLADDCSFSIVVKNFGCEEPTSAARR